MEYVLTGKEMKDLDTYAIEQIGLSSLVLMENAAQAVFEKLVEEYKGGNILILCGVGNNGADGLCVYRKLKLKNYPCECMVVGREEKFTKEFQIQRNILENLGINIRQGISEHTVFEFSSYTYIVDAIFGVGLKRDLEGVYACLVQALNRTDARKIAVDIPTGICSDDGRVCGIAVKADKTVTFGYRKIGMTVYPGKSYCGEITVADIGYPPMLCETFSYRHYVCTKGDLVHIPKREAYSHKGTFGKILVIAGSKEYSGASYLCAEAAYRTGSGLVKVITHKENKPLLTQRLPEGLFLFYEDCDFKEQTTIYEKVLDSFSWADVIVAGSGLSVCSDSVDLLELVLQQDKPVILDADALNIISLHGWQSRIGFNMTITPHLKEMSRLTGRSVSDIQTHLEETAVSFAHEYGCAVVLKDAVTVITDGTHVFYNQSGNSGMATGGSGDVLAGILGGTTLWWQQIQRQNEIYEMDLWNEKSFWMALGVYLHGLAGDEAAKEKGTYAMLASDIVRNIGNCEGMNSSNI